VTGTLPEVASIIAAFTEVSPGVVEIEVADLDDRRV